MVTIEIGNSTSQIKGLASGPFNKLRAELSYEADSQTKFFSGGFAHRRYCIDKAGVFNTGLLGRVEKFLLDASITFTRSDLRIQPMRKVLAPKDRFGTDLGFQPYPSQVQATNSALQKGRGIISMPTGSGKSLVIALITGRIGLRTLIVVPSLGIKEQLLASLSGLFKDMSNITVENIDSRALQTATNYDVLIIDEAHHVAAKTYQKLNKGPWKGIYYRFFLTATPFRNQTEETLLFEGIAGQVIYKLSYKDAIKNNYIVPIEAYYIEMPKQKTEAFTWAEVYSELVVNNKVRNAKIATLVLNLQLSGASTLCLVKEIAHGNALSELTGLLFANGQDEDTRQFIGMFNSGKLKALIGTSGILGEGVDTKPCEYVIISGLGKAKSAFMQQVGRAIRTYPGKESAKVILIKDRSHKFLTRHFKAQCDILLEEYDVVPIKLDV